MSNKQHRDAFLPGYQGPYFPPSVDHLRETIDALNGCNGQWLDAVARTMEGYASHDNATTSDGYDWFWALHFGPPNAETIVLIPWWQDWDKTDSTQADRSIAVYIRGVDEASAHGIVRQFIMAARQPRDADWYAANRPARALGD